MTLLQVCVHLSVATILISYVLQAEAKVIAYDRFNGSEEFQDTQASFGPGVMSDGMVGILVRAVPHDACSNILPPPYAPGFDQGNITEESYALISRGGCDFGLKVLNAQRAGYHAAIVHNVNSDVLLRMSTALSDEIFIPSVFIGQTSGSILNSTYLYNAGGHPYIQLYEQSFNPLEYYLIPFIIVITVCFVSLLCFMIIKCFRDRRRARRGRLSLQRLKKLPVKKYEKADEYDVCAICLDDYEEGETLRILPCSHAYHCKCVDPWLTSSKRICPLCKRKVLSDDETSSSSSEADSSEDERTPLVRSSNAASPNAARFATGYGSRNPMLRSHNRSRSSTSDTSTDTASTEVSVAERTPMRRRQASPKEDLVVQVSDDLAHSSGYQSQPLTSAHTQVVTDAFQGRRMDPDDYLDSAEAFIASKNRLSESSIAVLSDIEALGSSPQSCSSQDFHSLDDRNSIVLNVYETPDQFDPESDNAHSDHDDIIVITNGPNRQMTDGDGEV